MTSESGSPILPSRDAASVAKFESDARAALIAEIKETADKLGLDEASRGDLKILSRALKELRYAFKVFTPFRHIKKVTVFGSARTAPEHPDYKSSVEFGHKMAELGWMVVTGAGGGIMEGAHVGAGPEMSMGVNIMLPFEQEANPVINNDAKLVTFRYFFTRKLMFVKEVHAVVLFPGGYGTQDELFEVLTLVQTGKRDLMPIVCVDSPGGTYWSGWIEFIRKELLSRHLISPNDLSLVRMTDDVETAVREITDFYRVYDSMRYIRDTLVLRLHKPVSDELLARLNTEFSDILSSGTIERTATHAFEMEDEATRDLPRIALHFNRRDAARLRELIDVLNHDG
jgi:uncharacterized protein (TIGR00730 family)